LDQYLRQPLHPAEQDDRIDGGDQRDGIVDVAQHRCVVGEAAGDERRLQLTSKGSLSGSGEERSHRQGRVGQELQEVGELQDVLTRLQAPEAEDDRPVARQPQLPTNAFDVGGSRGVHVRVGSHDVELRRLDPEIGVPADQIGADDDVGVGAPAQPRLHRAEQAVVRPWVALTEAGHGQRMHDPGPPDPPRRHPPEHPRLRLVGDQEMG